MAKILTLVAILTLLLSANAFARPTEVDTYEVLVEYAQPGVVADSSAEAGDIEIEPQGSESAEGGMDEGFDRRFAL